MTLCRPGSPLWSFTVHRRTVSCLPLNAGFARTRKCLDVPHREFATRSFACTRKCRDVPHREFATRSFAAQ